MRSKLTLNSWYLEEKANKKKKKKNINRSIVQYTTEGTLLYITDDCFV